MRPISLIIISLFHIISYGQLNNHCFTNGSSQICFDDNIFASIILDNGSMWKMNGYGKYQITKNKVILSLMPQEIDSSYYTIVSESDSNETKVIVNCKSFRPDSSCKYYEYGIKVKGEFITFNIFDENCSVSISNIKRYDSPAYLYIGGMSCNNIEIPIKYYKRVVYNVFLKPNEHWIMNEILCFKIIKKKSVIKLKLLNTDNYIRKKDSRIFINRQNY